MKPAMRSKARKYILTGLYQIYMAGHLPSDAEAHLLEDVNPVKVDTDYLHKVLHGVADEHENLDALFKPYLTRPYEDVTPIELCVLRLAVYELKHEHDVPYKVVINEAIELAKRYGAQDSHKFVNSVLDKLVPELRPLEIRGD